MVPERDLHRAYGQGEEAVRKLDNQLESFASRKGLDYEGVIEDIENIESLVTDEDIVADIQMRDEYENVEFVLGFSIDHIEGEDNLISRRYNFEIEEAVNADEYLLDLSDYLEENIPHDEELGRVSDGSFGFLIETQPFTHSS